MSHQAHEHRRQALRHAQKSQRWVLLMIAILALLGTQVLGYAFAKGLIWGAMVAFIMQWLFSIISFMRVRPHPKQMVNDMYLAMLARFGAGTIGFLLAFFWLKLNGLGVIVGFLLMQMWIVVSLMRVR